jgi:hypothetical protein
MICGSALTIPISAAQAQTLFKCKQHDGGTSYQQQPCTDTTRQSTVRPPAPRAAKTDEELTDERKAEKARFSRENSLIIIQTGEAAASIPFCAGELSGFEEKHGALIQDWKRLFPKVMDYYERDEDGRFLMAGHRGAMRRRLKDDRSEIAAHCGSLVNVMRTQLAAASKK